MLPIIFPVSARKALDFYFHPRTLAVVRSFLAETAAADGFAGRILLHEDETLAPADCRICWQQGETAFCGGEKNPPAGSNADGREK